MDFYNYYENEVLEDARHWLEENVTFVSELMDKYTDEDGYTDMVAVVWDIVEELLISDEVCNNGLNAHPLPEFIDDVIYDSLFHKAMSFCGGIVNLNYLCQGKKKGRQYVDCVCRTYIIEDNRDAIERIIIDKFGK